MPETKSGSEQPNGESQLKQPRAKWLRNFWLFGRGKAQSINQEAQQLKQDIDAEAEKIRPAVQSKEIREILERGPRNIDEILEVVGRLDYKDFRYLELARKYGEGTLGKFKAFLAGEYDFGIDQHNTIGWNACAEAGRKVLYTLFNRRTIAATGMAAVLGILTGGVGAAASGVIFGSMAGRGTAEAISAITGKERGARKEVLIREKERWYELKRLADELQKEEDVQKRADLMSQITDLYFKQGENVVLKQLQLANEEFESEKQGLNKLRNRLQTLGEIVGVGAGIAHSYLTGHFASIDIDLWHKVNGQSLMHEVVKINDTWHFVYKSAKEATSATVYYSSSLGSAHVLGEPAWKIGAATFAERGVPVLLAAFSAAVFGGRYEKRAEKAEAEYARKKTEIERQRVKETIPLPPSEAERKEKWQKYIDEIGRGVLPEPGQEWFLLQEKEGKIIPKGRVKIEKVDWQKERVYFKAKRQLPDGAIGWVDQNIPLRDFLNNYLSIKFEEEKAPLEREVKPEKGYQKEQERKTIGQYETYLGHRSKNNPPREIYFCEAIRQNEQILLTVNARNEKFAVEQNKLKQIAESLKKAYENLGTIQEDKLQESLMDISRQVSTDLNLGDKFGWTIVVTRPNGRYFGFRYYGNGLLLQINQDKSLTLHQFSEENNFVMGTLEEKGRLLFHTAGVNKIDRTKINQIAAENLGIEDIIKQLLNEGEKLNEKELTAAMTEYKPREPVRVIKEPSPKKKEQAAAAQAVAEPAVAA